MAEGNLTSQSPFLPCAGIVRPPSASAIALNFSCTPAREFQDVRIRLDPVGNDGVFRWRSAAAFGTDHHGAGKIGSKEPQEWKVSSGVQVRLIGEISAKVALW